MKKRYLNDRLKRLLISSLMMTSLFGLSYSAQAVYFPSTNEAYDPIKEPHWQMQIPCEQQANSELEYNLCLQHQWREKQKFQKNQFPVSEYNSVKSVNQARKQLETLVANRPVNVWRNSPYALNISLPNAVFFHTQDNQLRVNQRAFLTALSRIVKTHPSHVLISGNVEETDSFTYNQQLARQRAQVIGSFLVAHGVAPHRIVYLSPMNFTQRNRGKDAVVIRLEASSV